MSIRRGIITVDGVPLADGHGNYLVAPDTDEGLVPISPEFVASIQADEDQYAGLLSGLLPRGWAWPRRAGSNLMRFVAALAAGFARVHAEIVQFIAVEADPRTTTLLLTDFERCLGLPDCCSDPDATVQERREQVIARLTDEGGCSRQYFIDLAASLGYSITIEELRPLRADEPHDGNPVRSDADAFTFIVHVGDLGTIPFQADGSMAEESIERLRRAAPLECAIRRAAQAHTVPVFDYSE